MNIISVLLLFGFVSALNAQDLPVNTIRPEPMHAHMAFLADDLLEGRGIGTRGYDIAASYVAAQFESIGLSPAGDGAGYFQAVRLRRISAIPDQSMLSVFRNGEETKLTPGADYAFSGDANHPTVDLDASVVFVGYAIHAPDLQNDDYRNVDVRGKIVAFIGGTAPSRFPTEQQAYFASNPTKWEYARSRGAVGMILIPAGNSATASPAPRIAWTGPQGSTGNPTRVLDASATFTRTAAAALFAGAPKSLADAISQLQASQGAAFDLPVRVRMHIVTRSEEVKTENVVARITGSDPSLRNEYIVLSAHLDHLGRGRAVDGDDTYNGALDNAVSIAMMIEAARCLTLAKPRRSILFLATTAEESGLVGADYFVHFPTVSKNSIVANVNLDGTLALYPLKDVVGFGAENSSLGMSFRRAAAALGLEVSPDPMPEEHFFIRADQYPFVLAGIPSLYINEGLKSSDSRYDGNAITRKWLAEIYHSPKDDMNQPILYDWVVKEAQLNALIIYYVAQDPQRPAWNPGDFFGKTFATGRP